MGGSPGAKSADGRSRSEEVTPTMSNRPDRSIRSKNSDSACGSPPARGTVQTASAATIDHFRITARLAAPGFTQGSAESPAGGRLGTSSP